MAKKKIEPELKKVKFIRDFYGCLNDSEVKAKKGDTIEVKDMIYEWLKNHKAI